MVGARTRAEAVVNGPSLEDVMRCLPLHDQLRYGLVSAPVVAVLSGTRYTATAAYDPDRDEFDYRLMIAPPDQPPVAIAPVRLGLFGRHAGARIAWQGGTTTIRDTDELADARLRATVELALERAATLGAPATTVHGGLRRKGSGPRTRAQRPHHRTTRGRPLIHPSAGA
jgi:hypothetical protein